MPMTIPLSHYIFTRLHQLRVNHILGVPGDFTLKFLDHIPPSGQRWIGFTNELTASYAADGYARSRGLSALVTTYGVGELSALNGIAGSYAEYVPVVHIAGVPSRRLLRERRNVHHSLGDGRMEVWRDVAEKVTCKVGWLADVRESEVAEEVDQVIGAAARKSLPVYLGVPADMGGVEVDVGRLEDLIDTETSADNEQEKQVGDEVLRRLYEAKQPLILVDSGGGVRHFRSEIDAFVQVSGIPTLIMPSGNEMVEHSHSNVYGVHAGLVGQIDTMPYVSGADLVLVFGPMFSDTQTLGWNVLPALERTITLNKSDLSSPMLRGGKSIPINLKRLLTTLTHTFDRSKILQTPDTSSLGNFRTITPPAYANSRPLDPSSPIDQSSFYIRLSTYLKPTDVVILGNATPILGGRDLVLPPGGRSIASGQWFSIGHMFPLSIGHALSRLPLGSPNISDQKQSRQREGQGRTILVDGDGGFQATAQDLGTVIRYRIPMTIFLINNAGYAYERLIHGREESYNDIAPWKYTHLAKAFGATDAQLTGKDEDRYTVRNYVVKTWQDLEDVLGDKEFQTGEGLHFVEVVMDRLDVPERFKGVFERAGEALGT
jgi:pyruvate decarboxylase